MNSSILSEVARGRALDAVERARRAVDGAAPRVDVDCARELFHEILDAICAELGASAACLAFRDTARDDFETIYARGYGHGDAFRWHEHVKWGEGIVFESLTTGVSSHHPHAAGHPGYRGLRPTTVAQTTIPLMLSEGVAYGALAIEWDDAPSHTPESFNALALAASARLSTSILLLRRSIHFRRLLDGLQCIDALAGDDSDEANFAALADFAASVCGTGEFAVLLRRFDTLSVVFHRNLEPGTLPGPMPIVRQPRQGLVARAALSGEPQYCPDTTDSVRFPEYLPVSSGTRSQYSVPLIAARRLVGVLNIGAGTPYALSAMTRELFDLLGYQIARELHGRQFRAVVSDVQRAVSKSLELVHALPAMVRQHSAEPSSTLMQRVSEILLASPQLLMQKLELVSAAATLRRGVVTRMSLADILDILAAELSDDSMQVDAGLQLRGGVPTQFPDALRCVLSLFGALVGSCAKSLPEPKTASLRFGSANLDYRDTHSMIELTAKFLGVSWSRTAGVDLFGAVQAGEIVGRDASGAPIDGFNLWFIDYVAAAHGGFLRLTAMPSDPHATSELSLILRAEG